MQRLGEFRIKPNKLYLQILVTVNLILPVVSFIAICFQSEKGEMAFPCY